MIREAPAAILTANLAYGPEQEEMIMDRRDVPSLRVIVVFMLAVTGIACEGNLPTAPPPPGPREPSTSPPSTHGSIYGMVLSPNGACLDGATIEIVGGPRAGERVTQTALDCEELHEMSVYAFIFKNLPQGTPVALRASMPGYESLTLTCPVMDCCFHHWSSSVEFRLTPKP